jgi:hypothetical protein
MDVVAEKIPLVRTDNREIYLPRFCDGDPDANKTAAVDEDESIGALIKDAPEKAFKYAYRYGIALGIDFLSKYDKLNVPATNAYVIKVMKPDPCLIFSFGFNGFFVHDDSMPIHNIPCRPALDAERTQLALFMRQLDPEAKYGLASGWYFVNADVAEATLVQTPDHADIQSALDQLTAELHKLQPKKVQRKSKDSRPKPQRTRMDKLRMDHARYLAKYGAIRSRRKKKDAREEGVASVAAPSTSSSKKHGHQSHHPRHKKSKKERRSDLSAVPREHYDADDGDGNGEEGTDDEERPAVDEEDENAILFKDLFGSDDETTPKDPLNPLSPPPPPPPSSALISSPPHDDTAPSCAAVMPSVAFLPKPPTVDAVEDAHRAQHHRGHHRHKHHRHSTQKSHETKNKKKHQHARSDPHLTPPAKRQKTH